MQSSTSHSAGVPQVPHLLRASARECQARAVLAAPGSAGPLKVRRSDAEKREAMSLVASAGLADHEHQI